METLIKWMFFFTLPFLIPGNLKAEIKLVKNQYQIIEAENCTHTEPFTTSGDLGARGGNYLYTPLRTPKNRDTKLEKGRITLPFELAENAEVDVWIRMKMTSRNTDSFFLKFDQMEATLWDDFQAYEIPAATTWNWHMPYSKKLASGSHTLTIIYRDPDTPIDSIALSTDPTFCPRLVEKGCYYFEAEEMGGDIQKEADTSFMTLESSTPPLHYLVDIMDSLPVSMWVKVKSPEGGALNIKLDQEIFPVSLSSQRTWSWVKIGDSRIQANMHEFTVTVSSGKASIDLFAICSKDHFTPEEDPYVRKVATRCLRTTKPGRPYIPTRCYQVSDVRGLTSNQSSLSRDIYGGDASHPIGSKTGFFHTVFVDGKYHFVDPEGNDWYNMGINHVGLDSPFKKAAMDKFGSEEKWYESSVDLLQQNGFNTVIVHEGVHTSPYQHKKKMPYYRNLTFMMLFARSKGMTAGSGGKGFTQFNDCIMPFGNEYPEFCRKIMKELSADEIKDPYLVGYVLDNELPFLADTLKKYLQLPKKSDGYTAVSDWLRKRNLPIDEKHDYDSSVYRDFLSYVADTYFKVSCNIVREYDKNHLICGSRINADGFNFEPVIRACGVYCDVVSINYYFRWAGDPALMKKWVEWGGKPFIITEWYAKGADSGLQNTAGAGWITMNQEGRGLFYETFALSLLQQPGALGFNWFRFFDDKVNIPDRASNKGIMNWQFETYPVLLKSMKDVNTRAYQIRDTLQEHPLDFSFAGRIYKFKDTPFPIKEEKNNDL